MTPEEKAILLQFMGETYRDSLQHDQMLVSQSQHLRPKSQEIKSQLERVITAPVQPAGAVMPPPPVQHPPVITPEQAIQEMQSMTVSQQPTQQLDNQQLEFDLREQTKLDVIVDLLKEQNKLLKELNDNVKNNKKRFYGVS